MAYQLQRLEVNNYRALAHVSIETGPLNVLFGPNGAGKSTFLDALWFVRDCAIRGVDLASSERSHGIGALWDGADEGANISIKIETNSVVYEVLFGYSAGRIEPRVGENLYQKDEGIDLLRRAIGSSTVDLFDMSWQDFDRVPLRQPERLAFSAFYRKRSESVVEELDQVFQFIHFYNPRQVDLYELKKRGSESTHHTELWENGRNLWSVLRNLNDRRTIDNRHSEAGPRFETITKFMRKSFPTFDDVFIEQTGPNTVYGNFLEKGRRQSIQASGMSDGHLQMLVHLTALFAEGKDQDSLILFDEPEISLHPYAITVFAEAVKLATTEWNKQVFIATHSPVLISQFEPEEILAVEKDEQGKTVINRVSEITGIQDLLEDYATGSLYMAEMIAPQSRSLSHGVDALLTRED